MIARLRLAALGVALAASTAAAQPPPQTPPPQTPPPAPAAAQAGVPTALLAAPGDRAVIGIIFVQRVVDESIEGKAINQKLQALQQARLNELAEKNKAYEAAQQKVNQAGATAEQRAAAQREVDRLQVDVQRLQQDAQAELDEARGGLYQEFERKLGPVVQQLFGERRLHLMMSRESQGLLWVNPDIDLTAEVIKRLDAAAAKPAAPPKPPGEA